jgi:hypothetical protein
MRFVFSPLGVGARMFEIVKRQHIRPAGHLVPRTSHGPQPCAPDMFGKQNYVLGEIPKTGLSLMIMSALFAEGLRTSIVRVIKCRKSIWWMPWR